MSKLEVLFRAVLNACTVAAIALGLSAWIATPLFIASVTVTGELGLRPYRRSVIEKTLLICGATVTILILIGLCLDLTPWGLTRITWAFSWLAVSFAVLIWRRDSGTSIAVDRIRSYGARHWLTCLYVLAAAAIFVVAGILAVAGVRIWNQKPMLAFALVSESPSAVVVKIDAVSTNSTYRIMATSGNNFYISPPISVRAGGQGQALNESVPISVPGRWAIDLTAVNESTGLRELIVDVGP